MRRPNPLLWLWYTFGGSLGPRYGQWVLHDTTCRTRWLRQAARAVVQVAPFAALVLTVAAKSNWLTWAAIGLGLLLALWYSLAYIDSIAEWRLAGHGYTPGTLRSALRERAQREGAERIARYLQTYR